MKIRNLCLAISSIICIFTLSILIINTQSNKIEKYIIGEWDETLWDYKKADSYLLKHLGFTNNEALHAKNVRIHKGEKWIFKELGVLEIIEKDQKSILNWSLKGRGNILEISNGKYVEHFDIKKFNKNKIELNYISDTQVKESARLIFTQSNTTNVTKI